MQEQIDFINSEAFRRFMRQLPGPSSSELLHGVFVDLHPIWQSSADLQRITGTSAPLGIGISRQPGGGSSGTYDLSAERISEQWKSFCKSQGKGPWPFIVTLWVRPLRRSDFEAYQLLDQYTQKQDFFVRVEQRPMATLASGVEGSLEVTASEAGSLGGFLEDQNGDHWGVTCGHVAQTLGAPFSFDDLGGVKYAKGGTVGFTNFAALIPQNGSGICNPYTGGAIPDNDGALLKLDPQFTAQNTVRRLGVIDEIYDRRQLGAGSPVCMHGPLSGVADYEIHGYGVTFKAKRTSKTGTSYYCFSNVFTFFDPSPLPSWLPANAGLAMLTRPLQGDSGSWVCFRKESGVCAYFGNLIAVQDLMGIATFADSLVSWAQTDCKLKLNVF